MARINSSLTIALAALALTGLPAQADDCDMTEATRHGDPERTRIYSAETGLQALYFKADMDVNTDGAARSYHPDDPRGKTLALNNVANAISRIFDAEGKDITCSPRSGACYTSFMTVFEAARDAGYKPDGVPRFETRYMIPWQMDESAGWKVPCTISDGPNEGYFISQTSVIVDAAKGECDQGRYLDSLAINANVLPGGAKWRSQGVVTDGTDIVVARDIASGRIAYGINGDVGPAAKIGEGSIAFTAALSGAALTGDETYQDVRKFAREDVEYLIFPTRDIKRLAGNGFTQADIDRLGAVAFEAWGGVKRLDACKALAR